MTLARILRLSRARSVLQCASPLALFSGHVSLRCLRFRLLHQYVAELHTGRVIGETGDLQNAQPARAGLGQGRRAVSTSLNPLAR